MNKPTCHLCSDVSVETVDFEAGNNAEIGVYMNLCEKHLTECDETGYEFEKKYADKLNYLANEKLASWPEP